VVARVNGNPVSLRDIVPLAKPELDKAADREKARPSVLRAALDRYINRELLFQEALARGLQADDAVVEQAYNQARLRYPDEKDWAEVLLEQGFDPTTFRTELRIQAILARLAEEEARGIPPVSDEEAAAFYDAHREDFRLQELTVRHILRGLLPTSTPQQRAGQLAQAQSLLPRLARGEKLSALAAEYSDDTRTRDQGGLLPPFFTGQGDPAFEAAALALEKPGDVSGIVETTAGFHILQLVSRRPGGLPPYESVANQVKDRMRRERVQRAVKDLEDGLRAKARVETYL
jgi:parvulin-like peptidyl-prolyl isomerase